MRRTIRGILLLTGVCLAGQQALAQDLRRQPITLPADVKAIFLAQMLGHVVSLDRVVTALGRADYRTAADVAASEMAVGRIEDTGGTQGAGLGIGEHMPEEFRAVARRFAEAAREFAGLARAMPEAPSGEQHQALAAALGKITNQCRDCHDSFRVE